MAPRLSVGVPTTRPWPEARGCLDALLPQVAALGGEIIVGDGHGHGVADDVVERHADVLRVLAVPGASVFDLRAAATEAADAPIIAVTEDHCVVGPDWCARMVGHFDRDPDLQLVYGPITNGCRQRLMDRANFFVQFATAVPPVDAGTFRTPAVSNVAFRADALESTPEPGDLELRVWHRLVDEERALLDPDAWVMHVQSHGFVGSFAAHFHNGRATLGFLTEGQPWATRRVRLRTQLSRPARMVRTTRAMLEPKPDEMAEAKPALPQIAMLAASYTAGAIVGVVMGPGASPRKLA